MVSVHLNNWLIFLAAHHPKSQNPFTKIGKAVSTFITNFTPLLLILCVAAALIGVFMWMGIIGRQKQMLGKGMIFSAIIAAILTESVPSIIAYFSSSDSTSSHREFFNAIMPIVHLKASMAKTIIAGWLHF